MYYPGLVFWQRLVLEGGNLRDPLQLYSQFTSRREAVVLVHGFNNDAYEAADYYAAFRGGVYRNSDLRRGALERVLGDTYWPGDANWGHLDKLDFLVYPEAVGVAKEAGPKLASFLQRMPNLEKVHFVGHSLGCRHVLEAVTHLWQGNRLRVGKVCLMAAAVPRSMLRPKGRLYASSFYPEDIRVLYSKRDPVLLGAFPVGQALAKGKEGFLPRALGRSGPQKSMRPMKKDRLKAMHGDYWGSKNNDAGRQANRIAAKYFSREFSSAPQARSIETINEIDSRDSAPPRTAATSREAAKPRAIGTREFQRLMGWAA